MRLLQAAISGFGNWVDESVDFANGSFISVYGENETGKSTMHQFILFMLFGLPPKRRTFFRPKTSSRMGGRLLITDDTVGEFTIERFDEVRNGRALCYTPDGSEYSEDWLKERLQGMTYSTYQSIFSFSALDLNDIETMSEADLGEVLLGIGLTGSKNILAIEKQLDDEMGDLFKPFGKKPLMNQQLDKLEASFQQLTLHKNVEATYREKKVHIQTLNETMKALHEQYINEQNKYKLLEKKLQALPLVEDYRYSTSQLNTYPDSLYFPENGLERLRQLNEKMIPLRSELVVLEDNHKEYNEKYQKVQENLYDDVVYSRAAEILNAKPAYEERKHEINLNQKALEKEKIQLHAELNQLQIGLTEEELEQRTYPFHLERTWNELKQTSEQFFLEQEQLEEDYFLLQEKIKGLITEIEELNDALPEKKEMIKLTDRVNMYHKQAYLKSATEKEEKNKLQWKHITTTKRKQRNIIFAGSIVLAVVLAISAMVTDASSSLLVFALFVFIAGLSQWIWQKQSIKSLTSLLYTNEYTDTSSFITTEEKEAAERIMHDYHKKQQSLDTLLEQKKTLDIQMIQWKEKEKALQAKKARFTKQMQAQYEEYPFLKKTDIKYWPELIHTIKHLLHSIQKQQELNKDIAALNGHQIKFIRELTGFLVRYNFASGNKSVDDQIKILEEVMEQFHASESQSKQFNDWMEKNKGTQHTIRQQIITYENELIALLALADAHTTDEFYKIANEVEEKKKIKAHQQQLERQITSILTQEEYQTMLKETFNQFELQEQIGRISEKMDELENSMEEGRQEVASENAKLDNMESSEDYSHNSHRFQLEQEQLQTWVHDWSVLKTAKEMLVETKRIYRDKYLHKVMEKTSVYFSTLTDNRYTRIFAPSKDTLFQVESKDLIRYNVHELSKGTIDQLYISLRLAISEVLSQNLLLPFIMDDAFVHFDSIRTERMMHIFAHLADKQQIIIFTNNWSVFQSEKITRRIDLGNGVRIKG